MAARILIVDDDLDCRLLVSEALRQADHRVNAVASAEEARREARECEPDVIVLDRILPGESGLDLLTSWRAAGDTTPVILLSGLDSVDDRVEGLEAGANDYLVKPFAPDELVARVAVQLRARGARAGNLLELETCKVDLGREVVIQGDEQTKLTTQEARTLAYLAQRSGETVPRGDLLRDIWGFRGMVKTRAIDNTVSRLRNKIEGSASQPRHVITVHGVGYRFEP